MSFTPKLITFLLFIDFSETEWNVTTVTASAFVFPQFLLISLEIQSLSDHAYIIHHEIMIILFNVYNIIAEGMA